MSLLPSPTSEHETGSFQSNEPAGENDETHRTTVRLAEQEIESVAVVVAKMVRRVTVLGAKQRVWRGFGLEVRNVRMALSEKCRGCDCEEDERREGKRRAALSCASMVRHIFFCVFSLVVGVLEESLISLSGFIN